MVRGQTLNQTSASLLVSLTLSCLPSLCLYFMYKWKEWWHCFQGLLWGWTTSIYLQVFRTWIIMSAMLASLNLPGPLPYTIVTRRDRHSGTEYSSWGPTTSQLNENLWEWGPSLNSKLEIPDADTWTKCLFIQKNIGQKIDMTGWCITEN